MAGARHHILPRFLLKGFASRTDKSVAYAWVYRKEAKPYETNTINIAVEKEFYGKEDEVTADAEITKIEAHFATLLDKLRRTSPELQECDNSIADLVAHLTIRTKNIRNGLLNTIEKTSARFTQELEKPENIKKLVRLISNELKLPREQENELLNRISSQKDEIRKIFDEIGSEQSELLRNAVPGQLRDKHNQLISDEVLPIEKIAALRKMNWFVTGTSESMILGDTACVFETGGKRRFKAFDYTDDYVTNIYLPISADKLVVGTRYSVPQLNFSLVNKASALLSFEFFVAHELSSDYERLAHRIAEWFGTVSEPEVDFTVRRIFEQVFKDL